MENFVFGVGAVSRAMSFTLKSIAQYQLLWGFGFGFFISTLVHGFLISDSPGHLSTILFQNRAESFEKINAIKRKANGTYNVSFSDFIKIVDRTRFVFSLALLVFMSTIFLALIKF
ncbi:MAG: hypothetical protein V1898_00010 [Patescibacteria group bacterium]